MHSHQVIYLTHYVLFNSFFYTLGLRILFLSVKRYLLWCAQDLANLEYGVHFAGAREERSEGIKLCHDAANSPLVYG